MHLIDMKLYMGDTLTLFTHLDYLHNGNKVNRMSGAR